MTDRNFDDVIKGIEEAILADAREIYTERVIKEAYNPRNVGEIENADGISKVTGPCGDMMQIHIRVENGKITDSKFLTDGCGPTIACGSMITELVKGKTIEEASKIDDNDLLSIFDGLPDEHLHCPVLAVNTLRAAIEDYNSRR
jgi:nitrogen fixation NifU-like protein